MQSTIQHLEELRKRVIIVISSLFIFWVIGFFLSGFFVKWLMQSFKADFKLIVLSPLEFIYAQIKLGLIFAFALGIPIIIYQAVMFVKPALKKEERKYLRIIPFSILLFALGIFFSYFVLKYGIRFLANIATTFGVANVWSLNQFISFVFVIALIFGLVFQLPLLILMLVKIGIVDAKSLKENRRYCYFLIFLFAAMVTPTVDPINMLLVAIPMLLLFEVSLFLTRFF